MKDYWGNKSGYLSFLRTDVSWVALGQVAAALTGLVSLKILTNLFNAEQYAYIALMMALSSWIWAGIYQPLNRTLFRYYSIANRDQWLPQFYRQILLFEKNIGLFILALLALFLLGGLFAGFEYSFILLVQVSGYFGIVYGCIHGLAFYFLAQRKRRQVTFIQGTEGAFRLAGGLVAFYLVSRDQYATIAGFLVGGILTLLLIISLFKRDIEFTKIKDSSPPVRAQRTALSKYFRQTLVITGLNASVIYLDKWFLFYLIGDEALGKYAVVFTLAMTVTSMLYTFFEMVCFPVIYKQQSELLRWKMTRDLLVAYLLAAGLLATIVFWFGQSILLFLSSEYVASQYTFFWILVVACGLLNFGRILMIEGQLDVEPGKYWSAYLGLLLFFIVWCLLFVETGEGIIVAKGFLFASIVFVLLIVILNRNRYWSSAPARTLVDISTSLPAHQPLVSIVIPSYNAAVYLREAIDSVLRQDYPNIELIVLNDGSTDNTVEILRSYPEELFFRESHANMGQSATMNKGWDLAKGEFLSYLSADDVLKPRAVSRSVAVLDHYKDVVMTYCDYNLIDAKSDVIKRVYAPEFDYGKMLSDIVVQPGPGVFFRRSAYNRIGGWNSSYRQMPDLEYWLRLGMEGDFIRIPEVLAQFRVHDESQTYKEPSVENAEECLRLIDDYFKNPDLPESIRFLEKRSRANAHLFVARMHLRAGRYKSMFLHLKSMVKTKLRTLFSVHTFRMLANGFLFRLKRRIFLPG